MCEPPVRYSSLAFSFALAHSHGHHMARWRITVAPLCLIGPRSKKEAPSYRSAHQRYDDDDLLPKGPCCSSVLAPGAPRAGAVFGRAQRAAPPPRHYSASAAL
ncbi:unnamed protein product [Prorocentrum cordatum]|uniref:Secreted protein n=1 Tax=Prorocentrum cordatum TaxID=2364126 RepID=A0ABN9VLZ4_9DINO|nr:unnamed protein product [Polarella glacialis]